MQTRGPSAAARLAISLPLNPMLGINSPLSLSLSLKPTFLLDSIFSVLFDVKKVHRHPDYNEDLHKSYDFGLLELAQEINFKGNPRIRPVRLCTQV